MSELRLVGYAPLLTSGDLPAARPTGPLDLSQLTWATPFDIAVLGVISARMRDRGTELTVIAPDNDDVRAYLVDVGLAGALGVQWGTGGSRVSPPLVPLTHLGSSESWDELLSDVWPRVRGELGDYTLAKRTLDVMSELVDNATTHGQSSFGTYVCAQRYTGTTSGEQPGVWIGIADSGVGIPEHLRRNPLYAEVASDVELIRKARRPWVTGTSDRRGWGLVEVFEDATAAGPSEVLIRSGNGEGSFRVRPGSRLVARYRQLRRGVLGAWIHVRLDAG